VPFAQDVENGRALPSEGLVAALGQCAGGVNDILPAREIINAMMVEAIDILKSAPIARL